MTDVTKKTLIGTVSGIAIAVLTANLMYSTFGIAFFNACIASTLFGVYSGLWMGAGNLMEGVHRFVFVKHTKETALISALLTITAGMIAITYVYYLPFLSSFVTENNYELLKLFRDNTGISSIVAIFVPTIILLVHLDGKKPVKGFTLAILAGCTILGIGSVAFMPLVFTGVIGFILWGLVASTWIGAKAACSKRGVQALILVAISALLLHQAYLFVGAETFAKTIFIILATTIGCAFAWYGVKALLSSAYESAHKTPVAEKPFVIILSIIVGSLVGYAYGPTEMAVSNTLFAIMTGCLVGLSCGGLLMAFEKLGETNLAKKAHLSILN